MMSGFLQVIGRKIHLIDAIVMLASELFDLLYSKSGFLQVIRMKIQLVDAIVILASELFDLLVVQHDVRFPQVIRRKIQLVDTTVITGIPLQPKVVPLLPKTEGYY